MSLTKAAKCGIWPGESVYLSDCVEQPRFKVLKAFK